MACHSALQRLADILGSPEATRKGVSKSITAVPIVGLSLQGMSLRGWRRGKLNSSIVVK